MLGIAIVEDDGEHAAPVSYTHLDVYKRQNLVSSCCVFPQGTKSHWQDDPARAVVTENSVFLQSGSGSRMLRVKRLSSAEISIDPPYRMAI